MKHLGDICNLKGESVPIVDIVVGGSPCQDLSVAGKRAGLDGERSGLFMEQIRIIKEMRQQDEQRNGSDGTNDTRRYIRPRFMVWENVPGAFSSNGGEDFRIVLEETARVVDSNAVIPRPADGWTLSGCILADRWSIAWRVHDAQFWGVPQRRRRIALVADFGGQSAPALLFERESVSGDFKQGGAEGQRIAGTVEKDIDKAVFDVRISSDGTKNWRAHAYKTDICRNLDTGGVTPTAITGDVQSLKTYTIQGAEETSKTAHGNGINEDVSFSLNAVDRHAVCAIDHGGTPAVCLNGWDVQSKHIQPENGIAESLWAEECRYGGGESYVMQERQCYTQDAFDKYTENETGASLLSSGGMYGGGSETIIRDDRRIMRPGL